MLLHSSALTVKPPFNILDPVSLSDMAHMLKAHLTTVDSSSAVWLFDPRSTQISTTVPCGECSASMASSGVGQLLLKYKIRVTQREGFMAAEIWQD